MPSSSAQASGEYHLFRDVSKGSHDDLVPSDGKKPLKGTFSVAACYDDINSYMNVGSGDNNNNDNYNSSSDEEDEEELY